MTILLAARDLSYDYPGKRALEGVGFDLPVHSITALVGPNGAGKTTLMRCLAALDVPLRGQVTLQGRDALADPPATHKVLGYLPDAIGLYERLTVARCLTYRAWAQAVPRDQVAARVAQAATRVGLQDRMDQIAGTLSRGLKQRLAIAQAIIHEPQLLILDEPASGLDPEARLQLSELLRALRDQGMTILVSSHILAELEDYSTHLMILEGGKLLSFEAIGTRQAGGLVFEVQLARPVEDLEQRLRALGLVASGVTERQALLTLPEDPSLQADTLKALIAAEVPVIAFAPRRQTLQDDYLARVKEARQ